MQIINYIHKVQGIDKVVPLLFVLKQLEPKLRVITILDIEEKALNAVPDDLLSSLSQLSEICVSAPNDLLYNLLHWFKKLLPARLFHFFEWLFYPHFTTFFQKQVDGFIQDELVLVCINTAKDRSMGRLLVRYVKVRGGLVLAYLKSVNDQGRGLSAVGRVKAFAGGAFYDRLMVPNQQLYQLLIQSGYPKESLIVSGFPPFYADWRKHVTREATGLEAKLKGKSLFVVFSRGPAPHKQGEHQIITASTERRLLTDIVSTIQQGWPDALIWIKPHPYQDTTFIKKLADRFPQVEIRHESVQKLSALASVAISTYSSASLDALVYGKPSIEYFEESDAFLTAHPAGSTFGEYGVVICRTRTELENALTEAMNSSKEDHMKLERFVLQKLNHQDNSTQILDFIKDNLRKNG